MSAAVDYRTDYKKRMARNEEKIDIVLRFLRDEYCTTAEMVAQLLGVEAIQPVYRFLNKMTDKGYLRHHNFMIEGRSVRLWGLTPHGVAFSFADDEPLEDLTAFQPSSVAVSTLAHKLDIQRTRLRMEARGATNWRYMNALKSNGLKQPDALATVDGKTLAFEIERTVKSRKRYKEIVSNYLFNRKAHGIDEIWYICPDARSRLRVEKAITGVDEIVHPTTGEARKTATLDPARLFAPFKFKTLEEL
ncbi:hypothetical protein EWG81_23700 [Salmonella enterica subsp. enterica serovar Muenchen]|jgi:hypothetical protein|uniref:Uncharacterized protein n=1 Tax=Salmonella muenchen TaxID=596 RepID=A0A5V8MA07_SALMU|nr:hypothetical protein [Salmonella enterica subsp. enterica serovar Muenchen]EBB9688179.1 hypothetical protein [Salmonella enterica]HAM8684600.1 hypothetical protein [Escherichia coli]EAA7143747.1 hypothetical protein [Salmonella enterica subsp. enterica serovar Muenchen]EAB7453124.1 hypothetical protein [Salmonella enterica subsp. enterica serovar Muenchen]